MITGLGSKIINDNQFFSYFYFYFLFINIVTIILYQHYYTCSISTLSFL